jgi:hypothetical protein
MPFTSFVTVPWWCSSGVVEVWQSLAFDWSTHNTFESPDHVVILRRDEREGIASTLRASCSSDAMDVSIGGIRHIVVDDVRDALNIQSARRNICSDHDGEMACFETVQSALTLSLGAVAMQARDTMTGVSDLPRNLIRAMLGAREDQH